MEREKKKITGVTVKVRTPNSSYDGGPIVDFQISPVPKKKLKADDRSRAWYAEFLEFVKDEKIFATLLTPPQYGGGDTRWDTWRNCEFNEILAFYGLCYWYTWQVSILGLGPICLTMHSEG